MTLLEALRTYAVVPNRKESKRKLLAEWIDKYDSRIMRRGFVGDAEYEPYWIFSNEYYLRMGTFYDGRKTITMRQLADMCGIDYDKWMFDKPLTSLVAVLKKYAVKQTEQEAKMCLLYKWIGEYAFDPTFAYWISGDAYSLPYWIDGDDRLRCEKCSFRPIISMREFAELCGIDYESWMPPKKPIENTERRDKAIREHEEPKKTQAPDPLTNLLTQIHIGFDGMTTHCVVKDSTGVVARSKATAVGEDKEHFDQLIGANVALLKLMPKEAWPEFLETLMAIIGIDFQIDFNVNAKLVNADEA